MLNESSSSDFLTIESRSFWSSEQERFISSLCTPEFMSLMLFFFWKTFIFLSRLRKFKWLWLSLFCFNLLKIWDRKKCKWANLVWFLKEGSRVLISCPVNIWIRCYCFPLRFLTKLAAFKILNQDSRLPNSTDRIR